MLHSHFFVSLFNKQCHHSFNSTLKRSPSSLQVLHIPQHQPLARGRYASLRLPTPTKHEVGVHQRAMRAMHVAEILQVPIAVLRIQVISLHSMVIPVQTQMKPDHYTHDSANALNSPLCDVFIRFPLFARLPSFGSTAYFQSSGVSGPSYGTESK